jgi:hypothetical protein
VQVTAHQCWTGAPIGSSVIVGVIIGCIAARHGWRSIPFKAPLVEEMISGGLSPITFPAEVHGLPEELEKHGRATVWPAPEPLR